MVGLSVALVLSSCAPAPSQAGGLEVMVAATADLPDSSFDSVQVVVKQELAPYQWHQLLDVTPRIPSELSLPLWVSVQAGKRPNQNALIQVTAFKDSKPIIARAAQVQLPRDRVGQLPLLLSQRCFGKVEGACADGSCEPMTGTCGGSIVLDPNSLGTYRGTVQPVDAGVSACGAGDCTEAPSCRLEGLGTSDCGPNRDESCCKSPLVTGGTFYLRYDGYSAYFPLWALARYRNLIRSNERKVAWGM